MPPRLKSLPLILLAASLFLCSCALESDRPLSSPRTAPRDQRLEGLWQTKTKTDKSSENFYLYIAYGPGHSGSLLMFGKDDKTGLGTDRYDFFVTRTPKYSFLNVKEVSSSTSQVSASEPKTWMFVKYRFAWNGDLLGTMVGGDAFSRAIKQGKLRGTVGGSNHDDTVKSAPPGRLLSIIDSSNPKDIFETPDPLWRFKKLAPP